MGDIYLGLLILAVLDGALFIAGRAVAQRLSSHRCNRVAAFVFLLAAIYARVLWDHCVLARLLPFSNLIVLGNWCPLAAGFLSGLALKPSAQPGWRRWVSVIGFQGAAFAAVLTPLMGSAPRCGDDWEVSTGVCFQTTTKTCSAASAATLLKLYDIDTTEQEMAELCLTRNGTNWMGLYRGLKKKTAGTPWDVEVFSCSVDDLHRLAQPAIITVGLERDSKTDPFLQSELGLKPGVRHSVVLMEFINERMVTIAEPTRGIGCERWTVNDLHEFYLGLGLRLVPRKSR